MTRSPGARLSLFAAALLGAAPACVGLVRAWTSNGDYELFWMALVATLFTAGVLASAVGRRRTRREVYRQSIALLVISTLLAAITAFVLGSTVGPGMWVMAVVIGTSLAAASVFVALARPDEG